MRWDECAELHYIAPIANTPSILSRGLLSHRRVSSIPHHSVADVDVQARRENRKLPTGLWLHEYVNLYFWARNSMMYVLVCKDLRNDLCVIRISPDVLNLSGVVVTDRNAASRIVRFAEPRAGLARLDYDVLFAEWWVHTGDPQATRNHMQIMCAEVLVPGCVGPEFIMGAYVANAEGRAQLQKAAPQLAVTIKRYLFF